MAKGYCELCRKYGEIERHHIFGGTRRAISEKYGAVINLCRSCHNEPPNGAHFNKERREGLQARGQAMVMHKQGWTKEQFRQTFGKNYIYEEVE
ncbi:MAG TPA: hypothetical protein VFD25_01485 [Clostridia bacterium]|nr:hypothetical protein [Clostridia bacterium]